MIIQSITTDYEYQIALERLEIIFDAQKGSSESDELDALGILIEKYEKENFLIGLPNPTDAIKFRTEQLHKYVVNS